MATRESIIAKGKQLGKSDAEIEKALAKFEISPPKTEQDIQDSTRRANPQGLIEGFFPQTAENIRKNKGAKEIIASGASELITSPIRFGMATGDVIAKNIQEDDKFTKSWPISSTIKAGYGVLTDPEKQALLAREDQPGMVRQILAEPSTTATALIPSGKIINLLKPTKAISTGAKIGGYGAKLSKTSKILGKVVSGVPKLAEATTVAGTEGLISGTARQVENVGKGEEFSVGNIAKEGLITAAIPTALKAVKYSAIGGAKLSKELAEGLLGLFSGRKAGDLKKYGFGFGKGAKELAEASGKEHEIGQKLVEELNKYDPVANDRIQETLKQMPDIEIDDLVKTLEKSKIPNPSTTEADAVNEAIQKQIDRIVDEPIKSAVEYKDLVAQLQNTVGNNFGKESKNYTNAMKAASQHGSNKLKKVAEASGNQQFIEDTKIIADKLAIKDKLMYKLGGSDIAQQYNAEAFIERIGKMNDKELALIIKDFEKLYDVKILDDAILAAQAKRLGPGGVPPNLPDNFLRPAVATVTGLGAIGLPFSSPRIAAGGVGAIEGLSTGIGIGANRTRPLVELSKYPARRTISNIIFNKEDK